MKALNAASIQHQKIEGGVVAMNKKFRAIASGVLVASASAAAFADPSDTVVIGFAAPLTGMSASYGKDLENDARLAIEDANAKAVKLNGRPVQVELLAQDDQADPRIGVQSVQALVDGHVSAVVGHFNSGTTIPASMVYDKAPMLA